VVTAQPLRTKMSKMVAVSISSLPSAMGSKTEAPDDVVAAAVDIYAHVYGRR
jgi:hypothetical protein